MIALVAPANDVHAQRVEARLRERGASATRFDVGAGERLHATVSDDSGLVAVLNDVRVADVTAVWLRRLGAAPTTWGQEEARCALASMATSAVGAKWVNPLWPALAQDGGNGKVWALEAARREGLRIPRTLATNSPERARAFVAACSSGAVYKPFRSPAFADGRVVYTELVDARSPFETVAHAPCLFQEYVPKRLELRATVVGDRVFCAAIDSQIDARSSVDFRRLPGVPLTAHELDSRVELALLALHRRLGLAFGCADLILTPEGDHVFLETNQAGQWLWVEDATGLPICDALCDLLTEGA